MFIWEKGSLNEEQEAAVVEDDSVLLVACPGSGKTRTLTYKIAYELSRLSTDKKFVIAITYTNNAADEIKDRVELLGVDTSQLWIGTIHAFCMEWILKPYHLYSDKLKYGFKVVNSFESERILTELCEPYKDEKISYYDCGILATPGGFALTCLDQRKHASLKTIITDYFNILAQNRQIDFEQILYYAFKILQSNPVIANVLYKLFPFILIDEYQDTKEIQYNIIAIILKAGGGASKTLIVGDPNQSIYDSLGGYPMSKDDLEKLFGFTLKPLSLERNYRSSAAIVEYFDRYKCFPTRIVAFGSEKDYPSAITFNQTISVDDLLEEIAQLIIYNIETLGIHPNEICIAAPQWAHIASLTRRLMVRLPNLSFDGPGMAPFSRDIENFWFKVSRIVLTEPSPFMYVRRLRWAKEILNELDSVGVDVSSITPKEFLKVCNSTEIAELDGLSYLRSFFRRICQALKFNLEEFPLLIEHFDSFFASSESRIERLVKEGNPNIGELEYFRKVFRQREGITVSTIHGTKGEEYDTVIGFGLVDGYVPHFADRNGFDNSKKMLYVLASRARKNLHLISEKFRSVHKTYAPQGKPPTSHLLMYKFKYSQL